MGDFLFSDVRRPNLDHPDSAIRLASVVHRFRVPRMTRRVYFTKSFKSVGTSEGTRKVMLSAESCRNILLESCEAVQLSSERVKSDSRRYLPLIQTILLSCKIQPDQARLDERLIFEWKSGLERKPMAYQSEAMMFDFVMTLACHGLGHAISATENSITGEFAAASRDYAAAAGIFHCLAEEQLPQWILKGNKVDDTELPSECHVPMAKALCILFMANGQQMAIATVLIKEGKPNYGLVAKLCLGTAEQLEQFVSLMRREATNQMSRMDEDFFTLITLQINIQKSLSLYFQCRQLWDKDQHGLAIATLSEATVALRQRPSIASDGIPDISKIPALKPLCDDLKDLREHMALLLRTWEKDNNSVYFASVPQHIPAGTKLQEGVQMKKRTDFVLEDVEPVLLLLPQAGSAAPAFQRSDSDLARELHAELNLDR